jgi:hypothetical protein
MGQVQGQGYVAQALDIADVFAVAYFHAMRYRPEDPDWEGRDRFLLSNGHYAIAHYADFYEVRNLLVLGRVTSGEGGEIILERAEAVLRAEFPELAATIRLRTPDEQNKRHGQATAAASLPALGAAG